MENKLGDILIRLRGTMSLRQVSDKSGLSHSYIRKLEQGIDPRNGKPVSPTLETLQILCDAYEYPLKKLLEEIGYSSYGEMSDDKKLIYNLIETKLLEADCSVGDFMNLENWRTLTTEDITIIFNNFKTIVEIARKRK